MTSGYRDEIVIAALLFTVVSFSCNKKGAQGREASANEAFPKPDHIVVVVEENHGYNQIVGSARAPFINQLISHSAVFTQSFALVHPSQSNYIALFSGQMQGPVDDDCSETAIPLTTLNLAAGLIAKNLSFKGYAESMPSVGFKGCLYQKSSLTGQYLYVRKHCPWVNWQGDGADHLPDSISRPFADLPADYSKLPTVCFVIQNMDNDMHNSNGDDGASIQRADSWLKQNLSGYIEWAKTHNSLFILTFDEDDFKPENQILTLFVGQMVRPGRYDRPINHYNVLRTIEKMYGLKRSGSAKESAIDFVWKQ